MESPHGCQGPSQCGACFAGYKRRPRVPSQGPFLWALLLLLVFVLLLHPPPSSEPGWAWRWHRGPFVVHPRTRALCLSYSLFSSPLCLSLFFFLSLSTHTTPPPPPPHHPPLSFPLKVSSLHKYEIIGKIELAASGDSGQNV